MDQSYPIYACTRANHVRYSSIHMTLCDSWKHSLCNTCPNEPEISAKMSKPSKEVSAGMILRRGEITIQCPRVHYSLKILNKLLCIDDT